MIETVRIYSSIIPFYSFGLIPYFFTKELEISKSLNEVFAQELCR